MIDEELKKTIISDLFMVMRYLAWASIYIFIKLNDYVNNHPNTESIEIDIPFWYVILTFIVVEFIYRKLRYAKN